MKSNSITKASCVFAAISLGMAAMASADNNLPDPDGKPADMSKPVQVFVVMGQSNTLEFGKITPEINEKYPFVVDDAGKYTVRKDVRNASVMVGKNVYRNEWLSLEGKKKFGIEIGIGHQLGNAIDAPVMVLKSSIGNRSLGWDLLPPGTLRYEHDGKEQPGYREYSDGGKILPFEKGVSKVISKKGRNKGKEVDPWYAGKQYDDDVANAKNLVLAELDKHYPGAKSYEVVGILWWQGDKDRYNAAHAANYEKNLVNLIKALRKDFNAPKAAFVAASLGQTEDGSTKADGQILTAMKTVASGKYSKELGDNIGFVYTHPLRDGNGSSNGHYSGNGKTYMNVGLALGAEMVKQLNPHPRAAAAAEKQIPISTHGVWDKRPPK